MEIKLYNTLSRQKETFAPIKAGEVSMYNCGPTVYDYAHVGNLRSYVFADLLRRMFEYNAFKVRQVINITDVGHLASDADEGEDKMTKALKRENKPLTLEAMHDLATFYFQKFAEDLKTLNIELPEAFPRASETIDDDVEIIKTLEQKGFAYRTSDGIYFDTSKFPGYGKLGNISIQNLVEGARVQANPEKRNPVDFALWKFNEKLGWDSPWGRGFPGWHIECSAMSRKYLGQPFDVHTGGVDHIPVHHNNEIAQSEAAYDVPLAHYWMHNEFLNLDSGKMAKSAGNFVTLNTLRESMIAPLSYRYWLLTAHYRSPIIFSIEALHGAQVALIRLISAMGSYPGGGSVIKEYADKFQNFINDDLDMPKALALAWELIRDPNQTDADKKATVLDFDKVFGLRLDSIPSFSEEDAPEEIKLLADERETARAKKDWAKADALRKEIESRGFVINDTPKGIQIRKKDII